MKKRIFTNSLISCWRRCKRRYFWVYIEELAPRRTRTPLSYGSLVHYLLASLYDNPNSDIEALSYKWAEEELSASKSYFNSGMWSELFSPEEALSFNKESHNEVYVIRAEATKVVRYYADTVLKRDLERWDVLWVEKDFEVPFVDRLDRRHKTWRYAGKWDLIVRDRLTGRVLVIDHKTTSREPEYVASTYQFSTQPVAYSYAASYLASRELPKKVDGYTMGNLLLGLEEEALKAIKPDKPFWPKEIPVPSGFLVNIIRKKVPQKPDILKTKTKDGKAKLSKSKGIDTTLELYMEAILDNNLNPEDYADVLNRLESKPFRFNAREEVGVGSEDLTRWVEEVRADLEDIRTAELDKRRYTRNPDQCNVWELCSYAPLCWGDEKTARPLYIHRTKHSELTSPF